MSALPDIIKTGDLTKLTDSNLLSALRTVAEIAERALSRKADDTAKGLITFLKGLVSEGLLKAKGWARGRNIRQLHARRHGRRRR